jgi:hypothetical protein
MGPILDLVRGVSTTRVCHSLREFELQRGILPQSLTTHLLVRVAPLGSSTDAWSWLMIAPKCIDWTLSDETLSPISPMS